MSNTLNITNGDSAVTVMEKAGIPGDFLPWRDVLHDGPVPEGLSLEALSSVRAKFISDRGWGEPGEIARHFDDRDETLESSGKYEKIMLWFEHDLYDQLQILQILDWFNRHRPKETALTIICVDQYLGRLSPEEMLALYEYEAPVTERHFELSGRAWAAFRSGTPEEWYALLNTDTSALPFLEGAIIRLLEEYPDCTDGLSRTARKALEIAALGEKRPGRLFGRYQESEERRFLGDSSFWVILNEMLTSTPSLLALSSGNVLTLPAGPDQLLTVTPAGREVLAGARNWLDMVVLDRWIGGVHLTPGNTWCRDPVSGSVVKRT